MRTRRIMLLRSRRMLLPLLLLSLRSRRGLLPLLHWFLSALLRLTGRLARLVRRLALLAGAARRARLIRTWPVLLQIVLPLLTGLTGPTGDVAVRIGLSQRALLGHDLAADDLRRMYLTHDTLVARSLLRRDRKRRGGDASAGAGSHREAA